MEGRIKDDNWSVTPDTNEMAVAIRLGTLYAELTEDQAHRIGRNLIQCASLIESERKARETISKELAERCEARTDKERFWQLLDHYPRLRGYWDRDKSEVDRDRIFDDRDILSDGERTILHCLAAIWLGGAESHKIDITDLATLDHNALSPIIDWLADPFWP